MRERIALAILFTIQIGILTLAARRTDMTLYTFILTYWLPVTLGLLLVWHLWPDASDD